MNESGEKRILIASPTLGIDPDPDRWLNSLFRIINNTKRLKMTHACFFPYRMTWWPANNQIWDVAFEYNFDYILRIDDDIHGVEDEALTRLIEQDKDVIGAAYRNRRFPYNVQAFRNTENKSMIEIYKEGIHAMDPVVGYGYDGGDVVEVDQIGFGMTLIRTEPFRFLERPIYSGEEACPDDCYFAQLCKDNGIKQYVHLGVKINHAHVTHENAGYLFNADSQMFAKLQNQKQEPKK